MSNDIDELTILNRDYVASVQNSDVKRFDEILAQDFWCTNPDKSLVDRAGFLKQTAMPVTIKNLDRRRRENSRAGRFRHHPWPYQLYDGGRQAGLWPLYRLLGQAEWEMAGGGGACGAVTNYASSRLKAGTSGTTHRT